MQLQIAQVSAELGKVLAGLERAVGRHINEDAAARAPGIAARNDQPVSSPARRSPGRASLSTASSH